MRRRFSRCDFDAPDAAGRGLAEEAQRQVHRLRPHPAQPCRIARPGKDALQSSVRFRQSLAEILGNRDRDEEAAGGGFSAGPVFKVQESTQDLAENPRLRLGRESERPYPRDLPGRIAQRIVAREEARVVAQ